MQIVAERLKLLRKGLKLSQAKMAEIVGVIQTSVNRYEMDLASPSYDTLLRYADYFDVSIDYLFGRTDHPQGRLYQHKPKIGKSNPEMVKFVDMCFDPKSPMHDQLKQTLISMLAEEKR